LLPGKINGLFSYWQIDGRIDSQGAHHVHQIAFCKSEDASWTVNGVSDTSPFHCLECHVLEIVIEIRARRSRVILSEWWVGNRDLTREFKRAEIVLRPSLQHDVLKVFGIRQQCVENVAVKLSVGRDVY
jgi:hypothetical protein